MLPTLRKIINQPYILLIILGLEGVRTGFFFFFFFCMWDYCRRSISSSIKKIQFRINLLLINYSIIFIIIVPPCSFGENTIKLAKDINTFVNKFSQERIKYRWEQAFIWTNLAHNILTINEWKSITMSNTNNFNSFILVFK